MFSLVSRQCVILDNEILCIWAEVNKDLIVQGILY